MLRYKRDGRISKMEKKRSSNFGGMALCEGRKQSIGNLALVYRVSTGVTPVIKRTLMQF